jgi:hypothetical protein
MNDQDLQEIRRKYPEKHPLRQMLKKAMRATRILNVLLTRDPNDPDFPDVDKNLAIVAARAAYRLLLESGSEWNKFEEKRAAKNRGAKGGKKKPDRGARDRWICERYRAARANNPKYSCECLRMDLKKSRKFVKELRRDGEFIGAEALRRIVKKHPDLA